MHVVIVMGFPDLFFTVAGIGCMVLQSNKTDLIVKMIKYPDMSYIYHIMFFFPVLKLNKNVALIPKQDRKSNHTGTGDLWIT